MIRSVYERLRDHFGPPNNWWPVFGDDGPFEMLLGAVLVQQTRWEAVEDAIIRLRDAGLLAPHALAAAEPVALGLLLRPVAFYSQKAPGIITISKYLVDHYDGSLPRMLAQPTAPLRRELLALPRIGNETADVILLYIGGHGIFVVDDYTRRLLGRVAHGDEQAAIAHESEFISPPFDWARARYVAVQEQIQNALATPHALPPGELAQLYADYHALINEACVRYCLTRPRCDGPPARRVYSRQADRESYLQRHDGCPLRPICGWYKANR